MKNAEMLAYIEVLQTLNETGQLGYAIARNLRILKNEATEYLEKRSTLFQKYGKQVGEQWVVEGEDHVKKFKEEMGDIPMIEHEVKPYKISEDVFMSGSLNSSQMETLLWMVEDTNNENTKVQS